MEIDTLIYKYFWLIDFDDFIIMIIITKKSFKIKLTLKRKKLTVKLKKNYSCNNFNKNKSFKLEIYKNKFNNILLIWRVTITIWIFICKYIYS